MPMHPRKIACGMNVLRSTLVGWSSEKEAKRQKKRQKGNPTFSLANKEMLKSTLCRLSLVCVSPSFLESDASCAKIRMQ